MREWNIRQFYWEEETDTQSHFWSAIKWRDNANFLSVHARFVNVLITRYVSRILAKLKITPFQLLSNLSYFRFVIPSPRGELELLAITI